jgi:hypothetical protein
MHGGSQNLIQRGGLGYVVRVGADTAWTLCLAKIQFTHRNVARSLRELLLGSLRTSLPPSLFHRIRLPAPLTAGCGRSEVGIRRMS